MVTDIFIVYNTESRTRAFIFLLVIDIFIVYKGPGPLSSFLPFQKHEQMTRGDSVLPLDLTWEEFVCLQGLHVQFNVT